ncbi:MAG: ABC transporter permease subunit [Zoogloeaceae bacterium]|nr:ABC transporter permease subunit [Zoogloeaceae bacterium]
MRLAALLPAAAFAPHLPASPAASAITHSGQKTPAANAARAYRFVFSDWLSPLAWSAFAAVTLLWPNQSAGFTDWAYTKELGEGALVLAAIWAVLAFLAGFFVVAERQSSQTGKLTPGARVLAAFSRAAPWITAIAVLLALWEILTAKTGILSPPFFAPPSSLIEVYLEEYVRLLDCSVNTLALLGKGVLWGGVVGFLLGVGIGWSRRIGYWAHPVLRLIGPLPPTALLPLTFFIFPSSHSASVFLIALATAFPVAILTWSGVAGVHKHYYDVARTLGASEWFLIRRVAIPAALPQVFVGLFMGFGASFVVIVVAEMLGVKSGLGWYLTWSQGYAAYPNMYAALILMSLLFSGLISLLFFARDRLLVWQKGTVKW